MMKLVSCARLTAILVFLAALCNPALASPPGKLDMQNFFPLPEGIGFQVYSNQAGIDHLIGSGRVIERKTQRLGLLLNGGFAKRRLNIELHLTLRRQEARRTFWEFKYVVEENGKQEHYQEEVETDAFFLERNILTFFYKKGESFFQISRSGSGASLVSEWGTVRLAPDR